MEGHVLRQGWGFPLFGAKPAGADREGGVLTGLCSPGLSSRAGDGECQLLVELVAGGGTGTTTTTPAAPTGDLVGRSMSMARAPAAPRRVTTRDRAEHRISMPRELVQDYLAPVTATGSAAGEVDIGRLVVDTQLRSGNGFSSTSSFHSEGTANEDEVNADVPPATPAGTPPRQLIRALGTMSVMTLSCVVSTALYQPATGVLFGRSKVGYYVTLAAIFAAGVAEAVTAVWLSHSCRRVIFGRVVLCAGAMPLVAVLGIGGSHFVVKA